ncbi:MAG: hypothetical protein JWN01_1125 [Patescibacteria group bacterium]|nr:hypothetical protein [Patescibacteria group bacterium]
MSNSQPSNVKFWVITTLTLLATAGSAGMLWPLAVQAAHSQAAKFAQEGSAAAGGEAEVDYRLATWLDPTNPTAWLGLARVQIINDQAPNALASLERAGEGSEAKQLQVRTLIELGRVQDAAGAAAALATPSATEPDLLLAATAYALAARPADITRLTARVTSPEGRQRLTRVQNGNITLASELYATGLLRSSSVILAGLPASFERDLLLARVYYARHTPGSLNQAAALLTSAVNLDPSDIEARGLLADTYRAQDNAVEAAKQQALITKLQAGRP